MARACGVTALRDAEMTEVRRGAPAGLDHAAIERGRLRGREKKGEREA